MTTIKFFKKAMVGTAALTGVKTVAIGGGVSANSGVREAVAGLCERRGLMAFIPPRVL